MKKQLPESDIIDSDHASTGDKRKRDGSVSREHSPQRVDDVQGNLELPGAAPPAPALSAGRPSTGHDFEDLGRQEYLPDYGGPYEGYGMDQLLVAAEAAEDQNDYFEIQNVIERLGALQAQGPIDAKLVSPDVSGGSAEEVLRREEKPPQPGGDNRSQYVTAEDLNNQHGIRITAGAPAVTPPVPYGTSNNHDTVDGFW